MLITVRCGRGVDIVITAEIIHSHLRIAISIIRSVLAAGVVRLVHRPRGLVTVVVDAIGHVIGAVMATLAGLTGLAGLAGVVGMAQLVHLDILFDIAVFAQLGLVAPAANVENDLGDLSEQGEEGKGIECLVDAADRHPVVIGPVRLAA